MKHLSRTPEFRGNELAHVVQFYTKDESLIEGLCQFVRNAIRDGESAVLVVSESHRRELLQKLRDCGEDVAKALNDGCCVVLDAAETLAEFMNGEEPNSKKFVSVIGSIIEAARVKSRSKNVAVFGEMVAVLWAEKKYDAAVTLEQFWNDLAKTHSFYLRCAYPAGSFGDVQSEWYTTVCQQHSSVISDLAS
jgi:DcmR-like sensory protein